MDHPIIFLEWDNNEHRNNLFFFQETLLVKWFYMPSFSSQGWRVMCIHIFSERLLWNIRAVLSLYFDMIYCITFIRYVYISCAHVSLCDCMYHYMMCISHYVYSFVVTWFAFFMWHLFFILWSMFLLLRADFCLCGAILSYLNYTSYFGVYIFYYAVHSFHYVLYNFQNVVCFSCNVVSTLY